MRRLHEELRRRLSDTCKLRRKVAATLFAIEIERTLYAMGHLKLVRWLRVADIDTHAFRKVSSKSIFNFNLKIIKYF